MTTVVCMKWGTLYGPEYVNRLHAGVRRYLARPFRFVCFTDDAQGLDEGVEAQPLPGTGSAETVDTRWRKLAIFRPGLAGLSGPVLFLDLDLVIVGDLAPFFDLPGRFCVIRDAELFPARWSRRLFRPARERFYQTVGNTSVFRFEAGQHADLLERFNREHAQVIARYRNEQEYLSAHLHAQGALRFWPRGWCASFKHDCVPHPLLSHFRAPRCPADAKMVVFAGRPKMAEVLAGQGGRWYRRIGPAPWFVKAWTGQST
jgi:hypothetical protein